MASDNGADGKSPKWNESEFVAFGMATDPQYNDLAPAACLLNDRLAVLLHSTIRTREIYSKVGVVDGEKIHWRNSENLTDTGTAQEIVALNESTVLGLFCFYNQWNWHIYGKIGNIENDTIRWSGRVITRSDALTDFGFLVRTAAYMPKAVKLEENLFVLFFVDNFGGKCISGRPDEPYIHPDWIWRYVEKGCQIGYLFFRLSEDGETIVTSKARHFSVPDNGDRITGYSTLGNNRLIRYEVSAAGKAMFRLGTLSEQGEIGFSEHSHPLVDHSDVKYVNGTGLDNNRVYLSMLMNNKVDDEELDRGTPHADGILAARKGGDGGRLLSWFGVPIFNKDLIETVSLAGRGDRVLIARQVNRDLERREQHYIDDDERTDKEKEHDIRPYRIRTINKGKISHHIETIVFRRDAYFSDLDEEDVTAWIDLEQAYDEVPFRYEVVIEDYKRERLSLYKLPDGSFVLATVTGEGNLWEISLLTKDPINPRKISDEELEEIAGEIKALLKG